MQDENSDVSFEIDGTYKGKDYHYELSLNNLQIKEEIHFNVRYYYRFDL